MADVKFLTINGVRYVVADDTARNVATAAGEAAESATTTANEALATAKQGFTVSYDAETITFTTLGGE